MLPRLTRQVVPLLAVRAASLGLGLISVVLCARLLQPENFGSYAVIIALITIMATPSTVGLRQTIARSVARALPEGDLSTLANLWPAAIRVLSVTGLVAGLALLGSVFWLNPNAVPVATLAIAAALMFLFPLPFIASSVLHGSGFVAMAQFVETSLRPLLMVCLLGVVWLSIDPAKITITTVMLVYLVSVILQGGIGLFMMHAKTDVRLRVEQGAPVEAQRKFFRSCVAFGALAGVTLINNSLDIVLLSLLSSSEAAGHYRVATTFAGLVSFGLVAVSAVLLPRVVALHDAQNVKALQQLLTQATLLGLVFALVGATALALFTDAIVGSVFGKEYLPSAEPLRILILGHLVSALFGPVVVALNMMGHERATLIGMGIATIANILLNFALIPTYGMVGAATASVVSFIIWNVALCLALWHKTGLISLVGRWAT